MLESQEAQYNAGLLGNCLHKPPLREEGKAGTGGVSLLPCGCGNFGAPPSLPFPHHNVCTNQTKGHAKSLA